MALSKTIYGPTALTAGVVTNGLLTTVDFAALGNTSEFLLTLKLANGTVAPGVVTITPSMWWTDDASLLTVGAVIGQVYTGVVRPRVVVLEPLVLVNAASVTKEYVLTDTNGQGFWLFGIAGGEFAPHRVVGRYCWITYTKSTEAAGAITTATLNIVKVRPNQD